MYSQPAVDIVYKVNKKQHLKAGSDPKWRKSVSIEEGNNATNQGLFASVRECGNAAGCIVTAFETALIYWLQVQGTDAGSAQISLKQE